ncbi:MAG: flagellar type III secretion system pore protein FliP [Eubacteriales bacterium]
MTDALININGDQVQTLEILFLTTFIALVPSMLVMMTCFTRFIIILSFTRTAMGTQQQPPNTVLIGMALILTIFAMRSTIVEIEQTAYDPYVNEEISQSEFLDLASIPLKEFMLTQIVEWENETTIAMYCDLSGEPMASSVETLVDLPLIVVVPAFITSELKVAFMCGFLISIPFLLLDMVIASTLMSMGMMMLPPSLISLPFKLLLFVFVDGWTELFQALIKGIY